MDEENENIEKRSSTTDTEEVSKPKPDGEENAEEWQQKDHEAEKAATQMKEIHRTFSKVVKEFEGDQTVEKLLREYKRLYDTLKDSNRLQKRYLSETVNLRYEIKNNAEKVNLAIHLSQEDKEIINNLTKQVNQAWNEVEILSEKESAAKRTVKKFKEEIAHLTTMVESGTGVEELQKLADQAVNERQDLTNALTTLKEELEFKEMKIQEMMSRMTIREENFAKELAKQKEKLKHADMRNTELQQKLDDADDSYKCLEKIRSNLAAENKANITDLEACKVKLKNLEKEDLELKIELTKYQSLYQQSQGSLSEKSKENQRLNSDLEHMNKKFDTLQESSEIQNGQLKDSIRNFKNCEDTMKKRITEIESLMRRSENTAKALRQQQLALSEKENDLKSQKSKVKLLNTTLQETINKLNGVNREIEALHKINATEHQNILKLTGTKAELERSLNLKDKAIFHMTGEINAMSKQLSRAMDTVKMMDIEKRGLYNRINQILELVNELANDNDNKISKMMLLLRVNSQQESQIQVINGKLVYMTSQRDNLSNALHRTQLKNDELISANVNFSKQSGTLAEELHVKEQELSAMHNKNTHLNNEINSLHNEMENMKEKILKDQAHIDEIEQMVRHLNKILCTKDSKIGDLTAVIDMLANQRNLLGYTCSKKMEQIKLLTEKNKLLQNIFQLGNRAYNHQNQQIEDLKLQIQDLFRQKSSLVSRLDNITNLKSKLGLANQQLVAALTRCRAMEGEHPYNLHRWRHLKAVDVSQFEMVVKIHYLLKRVIQKTDEVTRLESVIIDKTTIVKEMKQILERRPGLEVTNQLKAGNDENKMLSKRLKTAIAERNMCMWKCDRQVSINRNMILRFGEEQKKSVDLKKKNIQLIQKDSKLPSIRNALDKKVLSWVDNSYAHHGNNHHGAMQKKGK